VGPFPRLAGAARAKVNNAAIEKIADFIMMEVGVSINWDAVFEMNLDSSVERVEKIVLTAGALIIIKRNEYYVCS
jgi:hypothetical protein